jgi:ergothioneine biosynthesis protein EgtB
MTAEPPSLGNPGDESIRQADAAGLRRQLGALRERLLAVWAAYGTALPPNLEIRYASELNPPRWELGHIGWFEEYWLARNPQRLRGTQADPDVARAASVVNQADSLYHSSRVAHTRRWHLDLPDARQTVRDVTLIRERTLELLRGAGNHDDELYFFRLSAVHEAMHLEAWIYMAQSLAIDLRGSVAGLRPQPSVVHGELPIGAQSVTLGRRTPGFAFDNELQAHAQAVQDFVIDAAPVTWGRYLPFIEAGGYDEPRHWSEAGWAWRKRQGAGRPRCVQHEDGGWLHELFGRREPLNRDEPAMQLSAHEAEAWCRWAGRRLPTEAEWQVAANTQAGRFEWGQVWEWTATPFAPFPGFVAHPYRDYSQPWFDGRPVLRGASFATWPGMRHSDYRNYFSADRSDLFAGFRSCAPRGG